MTTVEGLTLEQSIDKYDRLIRKYAYKFKNAALFKGLDYDDVLQISYIAFIKLFNNMDPNKGKTFFNYAYSVLPLYIQNQLRDYYRIVRYPAEVQNLEWKIYTQQLWEKSPEEIAEILNVTVGSVKRAIEYHESTTPILQGSFVPGEDDEDDTFFSDKFWDDGDYTSAVVRDFTDRLTKKERSALWMRMDGKTFRAIGEREGRSEQAIQHRFVHIKRKWREYATQ
jgi:DNA-directed RNA polymerase specialized sigma subunit